MPINAGVGIGAFSDAFLKGYTTSKDLQDKAAERAQRQSLLDIELKKYQNQETEASALKQAISETPTGSSVPVQDFGAATGSVDQGLPVTQQAITPQEKQSNLIQRAIALGANPAAAQQYALGNQNLSKGGFELENLQNQADLNKRYKTFTEQHFARGEIFNKTNPNSAESVATNLGPEWEQLNNGHKIGFDKKTNTIVFDDGSGKPQALSPQEAFAQAQKAHNTFFSNGALAFSSNPTEFINNYSKLTEIGQKDRSLSQVDTQIKNTADYQNKEIGVREREAKVKENLAPSEINKNNSYADYLSSGGAGNRPSVKNVSIDMGTDANGKKLGKQTYTQIVKLGKDSEPIVSVYDATGKKISDPDLVGRVGNEAGSSQETAIPVKDSRFEMMRKKVLENKDLDADTTLSELSKIDNMEKLPTPGQSLNPNGNKPKPPVIPNQTSGSHAPIDQQKSAIPPSAGVNKEVTDINNRLTLQGISEETKKQLIARRNEILGLPNPSSSFAPNYLSGVK